MVIFKMIFFRHWQKKNNVIITRHCSIVTRHCVILTWHGGIITRHCFIVTRHCSIVTWHCVIITRHCVTIKTAIFCLMKSAIRFANNNLQFIRYTCQELIRILCTGAFLCAPSSFSLFSNKICPAVEKIRIFYCTHA